MEFAHPLVLLLISPVFLAGWLAIRKGVSRPFMISRMIILSLLIIALASPFTLGTTTVRDDVPRINIVSDKTFSMDLFEKDTGQIIFESIKSKTPTTLSQFSGISSPIGDEVIAAASGNNNVLLISDGNNNHGKDLFDAISFVSKTGTGVFAVEQEPIYNDASVEISSPKNLIIGNENTFNIVIRQAGSETEYRLDVEIDGVNVRSEKVVQTERMKVIPVPYTFDRLGTHSLMASIKTESGDRFKLNNIFHRSVFVVPKPKILFLGERSSPLYQGVGDLYDVKVASSTDADLSKYKAVILDNIDASSITGVDRIMEFTSNGGGLVVVGGDNSYDNPSDNSYNNSEFEQVLPVISKASEYKGGVDVVFIVDVSGSVTVPLQITVDNEIIGTAYGEIIPNMISVIRGLKPDSKLGIVTFNETTSIALPLTPMTIQNKKSTEDGLLNYELIEPGGLSDFASDLAGAMQTASDLLPDSAAQKQITIFSDGKIRGADESDEHFDAAYSRAIKVGNELKGKGVSLTFTRVTGDFAEEGPQIKFKELAEQTGVYMNLRTGDRFDPSKEEIEQPEPSETPEPVEQFPLEVIDSDHFITQYEIVSDAITGYNDVTAKVGSQPLVATAIRGKPILTVWNFGLGRVASFTTDNGKGVTRWASAIYSGDSSRLISSMINWAIGDPRSSEGVVIQAEDIWGGTPGKVVVTSDTLPQVKLDKKDIDLSRTGPNRYETSINLEEVGFHDLSGYGIAVNYPLEYREVGFNEKLNTVIESNGGQVYTTDEVESLLLLDIKQKSERTIQEPKSEKEPFLIAALVLFLLEVIVRRLKNYRKERPLLDNKPIVGSE